ncbi:hypothetical protein P0Y31_07825 [Knoellia sp. 3-2P3]|nr:hypothetical protein [Knoellia sp. 3-2P3]
MDVSGTCIGFVWRWSTTRKRSLHALVAVVDATRGFVVVGQASTGEESPKLTDGLEPRLVLMD